MCKDLYIQVYRTQEKEAHFFCAWPLGSSWGRSCVSKAMARAKARIRDIYNLEVHAGGWALVM